MFKICYTDSAERYEIDLIATWVSLCEGSSLCINKIAIVAEFNKIYISCWDARSIIKISLRYCIVTEISILYCIMKILTLPMFRLLSSKAQGHKDFWKPSKPCLVGIHMKALAEYSQMSAHLPGFQSLVKVFASLYIGQILHQQHMG